MGDDQKQTEAKMLLADFKKRQALLGQAKGDWQAWATPKSFGDAFFSLIFPVMIVYVVQNKPESLWIIFYILAAIVYYQMILFSVLRNQIKALVELLDEKELLKVKK